MLDPHKSYDRLYADFAWPLPERFNIAEACCDRWAAGPERVALIEIAESGACRTLSFRDLKRRAT